MKVVFLGLLAWLAVYLAACKKDPQAPLNRGALATSESSDEAPAHNYLAERLGSPDKFVRYKAAFEAQRLEGKQAPKQVISALEKLVLDPKEGLGTRKVASRALARCAPEVALKAWEKAKDLQDWDTLIEVGPLAIPGIRKLLQATESGELDFYPFVALTEIIRDHPAHPESRACIPLLLQALDQEYDVRLRGLATRALGSFRQTLNQELITLLRRPTPLLRRQAALAAAMLDQPSPELLAALKQATRDKDRAVRKEARGALKRLFGKRRPTGEGLSGKEASRKPNQAP